MFEFFDFRGITVSTIRRNTNAEEKKHESQPQSADVKVEGEKNEELEKLNKQILELKDQNSDLLVGNFLS